MGITKGGVKQMTWGKNRLLSDLKEEDVRVVLAKKNYRCCGVKCNKVIRKGTTHFMKKSNFPYDYFYRACSVKCANDVHEVNSAKDIEIKKLDSRMTFGRNISKKFVELSAKKWSGQY